MPHLEFWLLAGTLAALALGVLGVFLARASRLPIRCSVGRCLFLGTLLALGAGGLLAAFHRADGLVPVGLSAGFLVVALFIESPQPLNGDVPSFTPVDDA